MNIRNLIKINSLIYMISVNCYSATISVTSTSGDSSSGTLASAILASSQGDTIDFRLYQEGLLT